MATASTFVAFMACEMSAARSQSSLDQQAQCAALAKKSFEEFESEAKANAEKLLGERILGADYQSHYNSRLEKCFMLINQASNLSAIGTILHQYFLLDAIERRYYGSYGFNQVADRSLAERTGQTKYEWCELEPTMGQKTVCKTRKEFDAFVAKYMDE